MPDELQQFLNRMKILRSLDRHEVAAGAFPETARWMQFQVDPEDYFIRADDPTQAAIWAAIIKRETR